jgi:hypothetical protein
VKGLGFRVSEQGVPEINPKPLFQELLSGVHISFK